MPTNYLRRRDHKAPPGAQPAGASRPCAEASSASAHATLTLGPVTLTASFDATPSAQRILAALPLFSSVETWGESIHFELPVRGGRDRTARLNAAAGGLYYWAEEERVILIYGPTPISGNGDIRLPRPCNVLGRIEGDLSPLSRIHPGQKVTLKRA